MGIEAGLYTYLNARAGLTALVSTRIYPFIVRQADLETSFPAVVFQVVSETNTHSLAGVSQLASARIQITAWAGTHDVALAVRAQIVNALDGFAGAMGSITVQCCLKQNERDMPSPSPGLFQGMMWGRAIDFLMDYTEPVPTFA